MRQVVPPDDRLNLEWIKFVVFERGVLQPGSPEPEPGMTVEVRFEVPGRAPLREAIRAKFVKPVGWCRGCQGFRPLFPYETSRQQGAEGHCEHCHRTHGPAPPRVIATPSDSDEYVENAGFGRLGEAVVARICRDQGLCVAPFGIEHTSEELRKLARVGQMGSEAGRAVRALPDLAVYWPGEAGTSFWLLEVKTRRGNPIVARFADAGRYRGALEDRWCTTPDQFEAMRRHWPCALLTVVSFTIDPDSSKLDCSVRARQVGELPAPRDCGAGPRTSPAERYVCMDVHPFDSLARLLSLDRPAVQRTIRTFLAEHEAELRRMVAGRPIHGCRERG